MALIKFELVFATIMSIRRYMFMQLGLETSLAIFIVA